MRKPDGPKIDPNSEKYKIAEPIAYPVYSPPKPVAEAEGQAHPGETKSALHAVEAKTPPGPYKETWRMSEMDDAHEEADQKITIPQTEHVKALAPGEVKRKVRAIWIVHGMGQQIPFETVDSLTQGVLSVARPENIMPVLRTVQIGDQTLQRVELDVDGTRRNSKDEPEHLYQLHLYETYWAPKTEGVAKLADVMSFLLDGATRGLLNCLKMFQRAMFGGMEGFKIPKRSAIWITATLLTLGALTVINGVIAAAAAARAKLPGLTGTLFSSYWPQLTALASCMTAIVLTFGIMLFLAEMTKPAAVSHPVRLIVSTLAWIAMCWTILVIISTAGVMGLAMHVHWAPDWFIHMPRAQMQAFVFLVIVGCGILIAVAMIRRAFLRSSERKLEKDVWLVIFSIVSFATFAASVAGPLWFLRGHKADWKLPPSLFFISSTVWVWPLLIGLSAKIRTLLIQYVGDVAIYVRPNKLDRFDDVRTKIKKMAEDTASAIFKACDPVEKNTFLYEQVAVVGHSLGSVIAYDTLNGLMLEDWLSKNQLGIAERTNTMVTFGSPLDKTAFFFTIQGTNALHIRERLAATVQPIIQSYRMFRKFKWINVFSRNDIISGDLIFYDLNCFQKLDPVPERAVHNMVDEDAFIPLVAHVDYWKNRTVWTELFHQIAP
jgi:hypothetical protein